jgi:outer membrane lipoprotein-sorting protein
MFKYDENKIQEGLRIISQIEPSCESTSRAVDKVRQTLTTETQLVSNTRIWRIIMRSPITKLAVAAIIIAAVIAGIYYFAGEGTQKCCAWGKIADKIQQTKSCVCRLHVTVLAKNAKQPEHIEALAYMSSDYGYRVETYYDGNMAQQAYLSFVGKTAVVIMPQKKKYIRADIPDNKLSEITGDYEDPRDILSHLMSGEHKELGTKILDGVRVQGIESLVLGMLKGCLWVDVATEYPVRMELEYQKDEVEVTAVMDGFEWNPDLAPDLFEPNIPADFTLTSEVTLPGGEAAKAIEGFRSFAELTNGNYPASLDINDMEEQAQGALRKKMDIAPGVEPNAEEANLISQKAASIREISVFYDNMVQRDKDPVYYGKDVTANDANMILMRWKAIHGRVSFQVFFSSDFTGAAKSADEILKVEEIPSDDYRVLFGDLHVEDMTAEKLKEIEQAANQ